MFALEDPLAPPKQVFSEPWHAQALAMADALVREKRFSAEQWAQALGAALAEAEARGEPDNDNTYYLSVLQALESMMTAETGVTVEDLRHRKNAWEEAYKATPHGQPVRLRRQPEA